ncbi:MAG TPA: diacylglycerol kinase family protein [Polyangiaceae bacterium]
MIASQSASFPTWVEGRKGSFRYALQGLRRLYRERNARIHAVATGCVAALGAVLGLGRVEWALLVLAVTAVWVAEAMNTALEVLSDATDPLHNPLIGAAKDVAAGAVLLAATGAVGVGLLVFVPRLL